MIGIFDSGVGGLTVVKELKKRLPSTSFVYLGDNARTPYGNRSQETIEKYSKEDADFLISQGAKIIIVACNTASALAGDFLRKNYDLPIFDVINPTSDKVASLTKGRVGVIGTRATVNSSAYEKAIKQKNSSIKVFSQACPLLVPLIEENHLKERETKIILKSYLQPLKVKNIDSLVLGCTHYPLLKELIKIKIGKKVRLIDPAEEVVSQVEDFLDSHRDYLNNNSESNYFVTDLDGRFEVLAKKWLEEEIRLNKASL